MLRAWLRSAFLDNAAYKLVALLLSLTLFIVVHGDKDTMISFYVRVGYQEAEGRVLVGKPVDSVRVTVKGAWTRIKRFDDREVEPLRIDLSKLSDGELVLSDDMFKLPPGLKVVSVSPPSVRLAFEDVSSKIVPVRVVLEGEPLAGYRVEKTRAEPALVTARGPKSAIDALTEVRTRPVVISGQRGRVEARVQLDVTDAHMSVEGQPTIGATVDITEEQGQVTLADVAIRVRPFGAAAEQVAGGYTTDPGTVTLMLRGPKRLLDEVERARVTALVPLHAESVARPGERAEHVVIEGVPAGVAIEVEPRDVRLLPPGQKR